MSSFASSSVKDDSDTTKKKNWADSDSESDEEIEEEEQEPEKTKAEENRKEPSSGSDPHSDSDSDSDSGDEDNDDNKLRLVAKQPEPVKKERVAPLTKKEQKELKMKELDDLDAILAGFGIDTTTQAPVADSSTKDDPQPSENNKKKKKKKKTTASTEGSAKPIEAPIEVVPIADINSVLKSRSKKGGTAKKSDTISDAQKIAMVEAKKQTSSKKKRDKSKFSETSY